MTEPGAPLAYINKIRWDAAERNVPLSPLLELTFKCNHFCQICYNNKVQYAPELTLAEYERLFDDLAEMGALFLTLSGGEPLIRPDFFEIAEAAKARGFDLKIYSNGYLMADPDVARRVADLRPSKVSLSLHGARAHTHDLETKVPGSFDALLKAVENLKRLNVRVQLKTPITSLNEDEALAIRDLGRRLGQPVDFDTEISPTETGGKAPLQLRSSGNLTSQIWRDLFLDDAGHRKSRGTSPQDRKNLLAGTTCTAGRSTMNIDPYGNVYACVTFKQSLGSFREQSLPEIWWRNPELEAIRAFRRGHLEPCRTCSALPFCNFCMGHAHAMNGVHGKVYAAICAASKAKKLLYDSLPAQAEEAEVGETPLSRAVGD